MWRVLFFWNISKVLVYTYEYELKKITKNILDIIIRLNTEQQPQIIPNEVKKSIGFFDENENECSM